MVATPQEAASATGRVSRPSVLYAPTTQGGEDVPNRNQNRARSFQFMSGLLSQPISRSGSPSHSAQPPDWSIFAKSKIQPTPLPPPLPSQQVATPLVVPPTKGVMSAAETQQVMVSIMLNDKLVQQEQQRQNNDYNDQSLLRLEQNDRRRVSRESILA